MLRISPSVKNELEAPSCSCVCLCSWRVCCLWSDYWFRLSECRYRGRISFPRLAESYALKHMANANPVSTTSGDVTSLVYGSTECQDSSKYTHIGSGLGTATVSYKTSGNYITITIATDTLVCIRSGHTIQWIAQPSLIDPILRGCQRTKCHLHRNLYHSRAKCRRIALYCSTLQVCAPKRLHSVRNQWYNCLIAG